MRWDDQQTLKKFVGGGDDEDEDEEMDDDNIEGVVVEYAKSGRAKVRLSAFFLRVVKWAYFLSKCKSCYQAIANKELRVGEQYRDEDMGYSGTNWYHLKCFTVPDSIEAVKDLDGYSKLKPADKKLVETHFTAALKTNSKKRKEREDDKEERVSCSFAAQCLILSLTSPSRPPKDKRRTTWKNNAWSSCGRSRTS